MEPLQKAFGQRVRGLRKGQGLSQEELASKSGLHYTYVGGVERGEYNVSLRNIGKLAVALGVPVAELFPGSHKPAKADRAQETREAIIRILRQQRLPTLQSMLTVVRELAKPRR